MLRFSTVVLVAASIYLVDALPGGAPQGACDNLTPSPSAHGTPQANDSPYVIDLTQFDDNNGSFVYVPGRTYTRKILLTIYICMTLCAAPTHLLGRGGERGTDGPNVPVAVRANGRCDVHALQKLKVALTNKCSYLSCIHLLSYTLTCLNCVGYLSQFLSLYKCSFRNYSPIHLTLQDCLKYVGSVSFLSL